MLKSQLIFISGGLLMIICANVAQPTCTPPPESDAAKLAQISADAFGDVGSLAICLARLSCDPEITKAIYAAIDRCVERTRNIPDGISDAEYMTLKTAILVLAIEELKGINKRCEKIPFPCNNHCRRLPLDAPQEVTEMGNILTVFPPLVKCLIAKNDPSILEAMQRLIVDAVKSVAASTCPSITSVGLVKQETEKALIEVRKLDKKCAKVKAVNNNCVCGCAVCSVGCECGCGPEHQCKHD